MFRKLILAAALLWAGPSWAQNVTCATRPLGDASNACASTAFVNNAINNKIVSTDNVRYIAPYSSEVIATQTAINNNIVWSTSFGMDPTGLIDIGPALRAMTSQVGLGQTPRFPIGTFLIDSCVNDDAFGLSATAVRDNPIGIIGTSSVGYVGGTVFLLGPNIPDTCNILAMAGTNNLFGRVFKDFSIRPSTGFYAAGVGNHAFFINATGQPNYFEYHFKIENVQIGNMKNGQSFKTFASPNVVVTATIATTNMTVTGASAATIFPGALIDGIAANTTVVSQTSGTTGGNGVYVVSVSQTVGPVSVTIRGNNGGGALNNGLIENTVLMSVNMKNVGDTITFRKVTVGQGEFRGDPGYIWDQVSGATSITLDGGLITNVNGSVIINGGVNPLITGNLELETSAANTHGSMIDFAGATTKIFGGSINSATISQNYLVGTIYPVRVDNAESVSISPNTRIATSSAGGVHVLNTVNSVNTNTNSNYCTSSGVLADCSIANSSATINGNRVNIATANGADPLNVGGFANFGAIRLTTVGTYNISGSGAGAFIFPSGSTNLAVSGGVNHIVQQSGLGGPLFTGTMATTINSTSCTVGSSCTITASAASATVNATDILSGTSHGVMTNNAGKLGNTAAGTSGQLFLGVTGAEPNWGTMSGDATITNAGVVTLGSTITAGGPTGSATVVPIITYDAKGRLTTVSSATIAPAFSNVNGTISVAQVGGSGASHAVPVDVAGTITWKVISDCNGATTALNYTQSTDAFSCNSSITANSATTATNATNTAITDDTTTNATVYPTWVTANTGNLPQKVSSTKLSYNPSTGAFSSTSFVGAVPLGTSTGNIPAANMDNTAWPSFTPTPTCGNATWTVTSAVYKTWGKVTQWSMDLTISAIGTCTGGTFTWTTPNTPQTSAGGGGDESAVSASPVGCKVTASSTTASCQIVVALAVNDHFFLSGSYQNQ